MDSMTTLCFCAFLLAALVGARLAEADPGLLNTRTILLAYETFP